MAFVTACLVVVQFEPKVRALVYCYVVVTVKMPLVAVPPHPQLFQDQGCWRGVEAIGATVANDVRFPAAVDALPTVTLEALDAQFAVVFVIAALRRGASLLLALL